CILMSDNISNIVIFSTFYPFSTLDLSSIPTRRSSDLTGPSWQNHLLFCGVRFSSGYRSYGEKRRAGIRQDTKAGPAKNKRERLRSEEHTSELQSRFEIVCSFMHEKKK